MVWFLATVAYFLPWARADGDVYTGWQFAVSFSFTYLIGIILGLIVLVTRWMGTAMTVVAGILIILEVLGALLGMQLGGVSGVSW